MPEPQDGCVQPAAGPLRSESAASTPAPTMEEEPEMIARIGRPAPDFEAAAYVDGGFKNIKLSDYKGKWVTLCFYPGDFTFV